MFKLRRFVTAVAAAAAMVALIAGSLAWAAPSAGAAELDAGAIEQEFIARVNGLRASQGLHQLAADSQHLTDVARAWSVSMAAVGSISHRPDLTTAAPGNWTKLGENVGVGSDVASIHDAFVASPGHYKNLVDPGFTTIAVGAVVRDGRIYVTENFLATATSAPATSAAAATSGTPEHAAAAGAAVQTVTKSVKVCKRSKCRFVKVKVKTRKAVKAIKARKRSAQRRR